MPVLARILLAILLFSASAAKAADPAGNWVLQIDHTDLMVFEIRHAPDGWTASWSRPTDFEIEGDVFTKVAGPVIVRKAVRVRGAGDAVELYFDDPRPGAIADEFGARLIDADHLELSYRRAGLEPITLVRRTTPALRGDWKPGRIYALPVDRSTNAEMTAIFDADQKARSGSQPINWRVVGQQDDERRARTQALLDAGALHSADDYYHAAFVFQHGDEPADYLKAHILATISAIRGKGAASWIAAAALDRYLQSVGQSQVFGTQFRVKYGKATQEPYNSAFISNALRRAMHVPGLEEQEDQRRSYEDAAGSK